MSRRSPHLALFLALLMVACAPRTTPLTASVSPSNTSLPQASASPASQATPLPPAASPTLAPPPPTLTPTVVPPCTNDALFIADVTVPDGTQLLPTQPFNKKWSVENAGTCDWGPDYGLVLVSGDSMGAPSEVALYPALAGTMGTWEIAMVAPLNAGAYAGRWQARDPEGNLFGTVVFVEIEVVPLPEVAPP